MNGDGVANYYVIFFRNGGKMNIAGRIFHNYEQARAYADTIEESHKPVVVKTVDEGENNASTSN